MISKLKDLARTRLERKSYMYRLVTRLWGLYIRTHKMRKLILERRRSCFDTFIIRNNNPVVRYYNRVKNKEHIFIYSVLGRSSSTAFQRILNSSCQVCIFGELWGADSHILDLFFQLKRLKNNTEWDIAKINDLSVLRECYNKNKHDKFYPNAARSLDATIILLAATLTNLLRPVNNSKRFGFKALSSSKVQSLKVLKDIYPNSFIVFNFRAPIKQWISVKQYKLGSYWEDVNLFLNEYERTSNIYLEFALLNDNPHFVENTWLNDQKKLKLLLRFLKIRTYDESLICDGVSSVGSNVPLGDKDKEIILNSKAHANYLEMKSLSNIFIDKLRMATLR